MTNTKLACSILSIAFTALPSLLATSCDGSRGSADEAAASEAPERQPAAVLAAQHLPDTAVGHHIAGYFDATNRVGPNAERSARDRLAAVRAEPEAAIATLRAAYARTAEASYQQRWRLISLAGELAVPSARPLLVEVAVTPIPPERAARIPGEHWEGGTRDEEIMIRTEALAGLGALARAGDLQSEQALLQAVRSPERLVRGNAVLQLLKAGGYSSERVRAVGALLAPGDEWMLNQREVSLQELPAVPPPGPSKKHKPLPAFRPSAP
jgi:hypothetical protein